jgi:hypothetical protein
VLTEALAFHQKLREGKNNALVAFTQLLNATNTQVLSREEIVDVLYVLREDLNLLDDLKKRLNKAFSSLEAQVAIPVLESLAKGETAEAFISTEYCSATVDMKMQVPQVKRSVDPELYDSIMGYLGVSKEIAELGILETHFKHFADYLAVQAEKAEPLPDIDPNKVYWSHKVSIRKRKGLD